MRRLVPVLLCLVPVVAAGIWYATAADAGLPMVQFELAGSADAAARIVDGRTPRFQAALTADYVFMVGYSGTMSAACLLALRRTARASGRVLRTAWVCAALAAPLVATLDLLENLSLARGLTSMADDAFRRAAWFATAKFLLLAPTVAISVTALIRAARTRPTHSHNSSQTSSASSPSAAARVSSSGTSVAEP